MDLVYYNILTSKEYQVTKEFSETCPSWRKTPDYIQIITN